MRRCVVRQATDPQPRRVAFDVPGICIIGNSAGDYRDDRRLAVCRAFKTQFREVAFVGRKGGHDGLLEAYRSAYSPNT